MTSALLIFALALAAGLAVWRVKGREGVVAGARLAWKQSQPLATRMPLALLMAGFAVKLLPEKAIEGAIGAGSGWYGVAVASLVGGLLPGGPMVSFPLAVAIYQGGAGLPQMIAFVTAWAVFAFHRIIAYEIPIMGGRFAILRFVASLVLPFVAALGAAAIAAALG